jgi:polar amino acid transport system substrate-binding protein
MRKTLVLICVLLLCGWAAFAKDYTVAILQLPTAEAYVNLFKAISEVTKNNFTTQLVPPARAVAELENKKADVLFPATKSTDPQKNAARSYDLSTAKVYSMVFVLYTNKSKPIDIAQLKSGNPNKYQVETTASLAGLFEFRPIVTTSTEFSLKKVDIARIDGLIYAQEVADPQVKEFGLKRIARSLYSLNDITFGLQKGQSGSELDKVLVDGIAKLKASGRLNTILEGPMKNSIYNDWQP